MDGRVPVGSPGSHRAIVAAQGLEPRGAHVGFQAPGGEGQFIPPERAISKETWRHEYGGRQPAARQFRDPKGDGAPIGVVERDRRSGTLV